MQVYAAIQEETSGRVYQILKEQHLYFWLRATPGCAIIGPFDSFGDLFESLAKSEGKTAKHWENAFGRFYPHISPSGAFRTSHLSV